MKIIRNFVILKALFNSRINKKMFNFMINKKNNIISKMGFKYTERLRVPYSAFITVEDEM